MAPASGMKTAIPLGRSGKSADCAANALEGFGRARTQFERRVSTALDLVGARETAAGDALGLRSSACSSPGSVPDGVFNSALILVLHQTICPNHSHSNGSAIWDEDDDPAPALWQKRRPGCCCARRSRTRWLGLGSSAGLARSMMSGRAKPPPPTCSNCVRALSFSFQFRPRLDRVAARFPSHLRSRTAPRASECFVGQTAITRPL